MKFTNKKVLVVGTGKSGVAAVRLLNKSGAEVIVLFDRRNHLKISKRC